MPKLATDPKGACDALHVGTTKLYELITAGELETFKIGTGTRITVASIEAYIDRQLAAAKAA